ncbi:MAG: biotin--[Lachnospiraceae bacterium]|nr:biotin--[acetyl-CoA-carboxylase] ligase [Lachnospiraceae bacterium]
MRNPEDLKTERETARIVSDAHPAGWIGAETVRFDETDSTNLQAKRLAEEGASDGTLVVAECQTAGRGRLGRSFSSPQGEGIFMSVILRPEAPADQVSCLTLLAALAVQQGIGEIAGIGCGIKWPNDIIIHGKKVCGILTEMSMEERRVRHVVIGIGINCGNRDFPEELKEVATSLFLETGRQIRKDALIRSVWSAFEPLYESFLRYHDLREVREAYNQLLINREREVEVLDPDGAWKGSALGINEKGALLVKNKAGELIEISTGEVSVRGVYGYV